MHFTKIRMTGFKSFVEPTEVVIEKGLTGIVGPNGCGKSNLVEALRWAMGETSAKKIRGGEMDDVIFAGTDNRPARNLAEVMLVLDNADRKAPAAFNGADLLEVARRIERGEGSHYRINGQDVRARDVQLMFADVATGARSPALVSQGRIGALVSAKPAERRLLLEEAAGITGLHSRRHEAELRLRAAEGNLERLDDVLGALDTQLQGLKRQARQAGRYKRLADHIRRQEAILYHLRWLETSARLEAARQALADAVRAVEDASTEAARATTAQAEIAETLPGLRKSEAEAGAELQRATLALRQLEDEERRIDQALQDALRRQEQTAADLARETTRREDAATAIRSLTGERDGIQRDQNLETEGRAKAARDAQEAVDAVEETETRLGVLTGEIAVKDAEAQGIGRQIAEATARLDRLRDRAATLERQREQLRADGIDVDTLGAAESELRGKEEAVDAAKRAVEQAEKSWREAQVAEAGARDDLQAAQEAATRLSAEEDALADLLTENDGENWQPVLDRIEVEPGFEAALGAAFGDDLLAALDDKAPVRWRLFSWLAGDGAAPLPPSLPEGSEPLSAHVEAPGALAGRLAQIGVVADEAAAERLQGDLAQGQRLVTRDGGLWRWDGYSVRPGSATAAGARLSQRARLDAIRREKAETDTKLRRAQEAFETARSGAAHAAGDAARAQNALRDAYGAVHAAQGRHADLRQKNEGLASRLAALHDAMQHAEQDLEAAEAAVASLRETEASLPDLTQRREEARTLRADLGEKRARYIERQNILNQFTQRAEARRERMQRIDEDLANWARRRDDATAQLEQLAQRRADVENDIQRLRDAPEKLAAERETLTGLIGDAAQRRDWAAQNLAAAEARLAEADRALKAAEHTLADARENRIRREGGVEQGEQAARELTDRIRERIDVAPEAVLDAAGLAPEEELPDAVTVEAKLERLVAERERLGAVNLRAEEEAAELDARITTMQTERADLIAAIARLRQGIQSLNREGRERLLAAFQEVDQHFQHLFKRLFGGGTAHMKLIESDDPLEAGLEIYASPPGKKLQSLSLLSGGEQALTALSMLFAVFLTSPAPICVLDEVDAPLDDANVDRFCTLLEELSRSMDTRFVVVTHHRMTMARMDRLFGVTMAERGVSQVVSVDLQEAERIRQTA